MGNLRRISRAGGLTTDYSYDALHRLVQVLDYRYVYNADGIRIGQIVDGVSEHLVVDSNRDYAQVLATQDDSGTVTAAYTHGLDLLNQYRDGQRGDYLADGLGSVRTIMHGSSVADEYRYDAWGNTLYQSGDAENPYRYTGEWYDSALDQYYLRARTYAPQSGRFVQMDAWRGDNLLPKSYNKYAYAALEPTGYTDPSGHMFLASLSIGGFGSNTIRYASFSLSYKVAYTAVIGTTLTILNYQIRLFFADFENFTSSDELKSESDATSRARQSEYERAKRFCDDGPETGRNDCSSLSKKIDHAQMCIDLYQAWDDKWLSGRHAQKISDWKNRLEKAKKEHKRQCTNK